MEGFQEQAIPLITYNQQESIYQVNEEAAEFVKSIPQPLGVVAVAGLYRTGKSYLLNRMLLNRSNGFGVGPTVNPCTKGLWIWGTPIKGYTPEGEPMNILIIDSEGIGALDEDQNHDNKVFSLAILLSSCFIYNSVGSIDENAIQNLSLVVNLTKNIQIKSNGNEECDSEEYSQHFPSFFWVIRDFSLQLVDQDGEPISSKDYLEKSLTEQRGFSDEIESKNRIRRLLTSFFKQRECVTLVRPLVNEDNLQKLDQMELDQLRPEFFEQVMVFRKRILSHCKPKTINGKALNGDMYLSLMKNYVDSINGGAVPNIENAWSYVCKDECYKATTQAIDAYQKSIRDILYPKLPTTLEDLKCYHRQAKEQALEIFQKMAIGDVAEEYQRKVLSKIKDTFQQIQYENEKLSLDNAKNFIEREFSSIDKKLKMLEYKTYAEFNNDVQLFYKFLLEHGPKVVNRHLFYLDFMQKKLHEGATIFLKNLQNDLEISKTCSQEIIEKNEKELKEVKEAMMQQNSTLEQTVNQLEKEKLELASNEKRNEETIKEQQETYEKMELELKAEIQKEKSAFSSNIDSVKAKLAQSEEELQEVQRDLLIKESDFQKEKALLEHKANHFETLVKEQNEKEKQFDSNMSTAKNQLNVQMKEMQDKYDQIIKNSKNQNLSLTEKLAELQEQKENQEKNLESQLELFKEKNTILTNNLDEANSKLSEQRKELDRVLGDSQIQSKNIETIVQSQLEELKAQNITLDAQVKELTEKLKNEEQNNRKQEALLQQKSEFLSAELEETKEKLEAQREGHQQTLKALEMTNLEQQRDLANQTESKRLLEMKEMHMKEMQRQENDFNTKSSQFQEQIENLSKSNQDVSLKLKLQETDFEDQLTALKESLQVTEQQRNDLTERLSAFEQSSYQNSQQTEALQQKRIAELEEDNEELREKLQKENYDQQLKSEEQLAQLKNIYEIEKERLEKRLIEEREKRERGQEGIQEEFEERIREQAEAYEEEIENLKDDLLSHENTISNITSQYEHELDLKIKNIENMEKSIIELKEQLSSVQKSTSQQLEQQIALFNQEKASLSQKVEEMTTEIQKKEKDLIKIQQKKESIENAFARKEELWEQTKTDLLQEKTQVADKLEETRKTHQKLQDEFLQHKINYEKSIALSTQQNEFFEKKVEELQKQLEQSSSRYEERIKSQKSEWQIELNEKLGRLQEEKQALEIKYETLKKNNKEGDLSQTKKISALEKEKAIIQEKLTHTSAKLNELEEKSKEQIEQLTSQLTVMKSQINDDKKVSSTEIEVLKKQINVLEQEKHDLQSGLERDLVLWEGKFNFLTQQKEQAKNDLQEARKNFEQTLQKLKEARNNDQSQHENNVQEQLVSIEKKYQTQIQELTDSNYQQVSNLNQKIKKLEKELQQHADKSLMEQHSKNTNQIFTEKKMQELFDSQKKLQEQLEIAKADKEKLQQELSKKQEKEKETFKGKINEIEEKFREGERKRSTLIFEHEKERAKWNLEKDHLLSQKNDLQESMNRLEKKKEQLLRENERLKNDNRQNRRHNQANPGTSFNLNVSRNMSSDRKSPISNRNTYMLGGGYANRFNDHSIINNSFQNEDNDTNSIGTNKENHNISILGQLDSARDKDLSGVSVQKQGFQTFLMKNNPIAHVTSTQSSEQSETALQEKDLN